MDKKRSKVDKQLKKLILRYNKHIHPNRLDLVIKFIASFVRISFLLFLSILLGILGFMLIEGLNFVDSLYMTLITISTVGFGEVRPLSYHTRLFVSFFILTNIGIFAYTVGLFAGYVVEGQFREVFKNLVIGRKMNRMKNHIIVCGYGRYGKNVVEQLVAQNHEVVLIESDIEKTAVLRQKKNVTVLDGDATDEDFLKEAGVLYAKALITTLPVDADNVYVILSARQLNSNIKIISRATQASSKKKMVHAGANHVLVPENIGGFYMSSLVTKPDIVDIFDEILGMGSSGFKMVEIILRPLPKRLANQTLGDLQIETRTGVKIIGIKTPGLESKINPKLDLPLLEGMAIIVLGNSEQIEAFHEHTSEFIFIE